jgi:hypothetical protein
MNGCQLTAFITAFANSIAASSTPEQIELFAAIFTQLGDTLATISVASDCQEQLPDR